MSKPEPFALTLRTALDERDLTARQLALRIGLAPSAIYKVLNDGMVPTIETTERIARVLEIRPEAFAEYRLQVAQDSLDWRKHGLGSALKALGE